MARWVRDLLRCLQPRSGARSVVCLKRRVLAEQRERHARIEPRLWGPLLRWSARQPAVLILLAVPRAQRNLDRSSSTPVASTAIEDKLRHLLTELPIQENYFWRVYLLGAYSAQCCPTICARSTSRRWRSVPIGSGTHTATLSAFLSESQTRFNQFVLLDHQDWMACASPGVAG